MDVDLGARAQGPDKLGVAARWAATPLLSLRMQSTYLASRDVNEGRMAGTAKLEEHFRGYTLTDFTASYRSRFGELGLGIENLFNKQYVGFYSQSNPAGTNEDYFAGRGRTYTLSWRRSFD